MQREKGKKIINKNGEKKRVRKREKKTLNGNANVLPVLKCRLMRKALLALAEAGKDIEEIL